VGDLVAAFRSYRSAWLPGFPGAREMLGRLRRRIPVACVTDGDPSVQRAKLAALDLDVAFDSVVISDEIGRAFRKPHAAPFLAALGELGVAAADAVHIGDRPAKDVVGPHRLGMRAIRVCTGEYADAPDASPPADFTFPDATAALAALCAVVSGPAPVS
jgi:putative hydrolase of the HAD superfamily